MDFYLVLLLGTYFSIYSFYWTLCVLDKITASPSFEGVVFHRPRNLSFRLSLALKPL